MSIKVVVEFNDGSVEEILGYSGLDYAASFLRLYPIASEGDTGVGSIYLSPSNIKKVTRAPL